MKSLFNIYEAYTEDGLKLSDEIKRVFDPILKKWIEKGYSTIEINTITLNVIEASACIARMENALKRHKEEKRKEKLIADSQRVR